MQVDGAGGAGTQQHGAMLPGPTVPCGQRLRKLAWLRHGWEQTSDEPADQAHLQAFLANNLLGLTKGCTWRLQTATAKGGGGDAGRLARSLRSLNRLPRAATCATHEDGAVDAGGTENDTQDGGGNAGRLALSLCSLARLPRVATGAALERQGDQAAEAPRGVSLNRFAQSLAAPRCLPRRPRGSTEKRAAAWTRRRIKDTYILRAAVATRGVSLVRFRSLTRLPRVATCAAYESDTTGTAEETEDGRDPLLDHQEPSAEGRR